MTSRALLALLILLTAVLLRSPHGAQADPNNLVGPLVGQTSWGLWTSYPFPVQAGASYTVRLEPQNGDADVWLYLDGERVAVGRQSGRVAEDLQLTASRDGTAVAWVTGFGDDVTYRLVVQRGAAMADRGPATAVASTRGATSAPATAVPSTAPASGKVGLQVGHWRYWEAGPPLDRQPGSSGGGKTEWEVNLAIAEQTAALLRAIGYTVELLPTAFPSGYRADVVVAIHADGGPPDRRGFFADRPAQTTIAAVEDRLVALLNAAYAEATGIPYQYRGTAGTRFYYGYTRVTSDTPIALIETGFLTNAADREIIVGDPARAARGIANAIDQFLRERAQRR